MASFSARCMSCSAVHSVIQALSIAQQIDRYEEGVYLEGGRLERMHGRGIGVHQQLRVELQRQIHNAARSVRHDAHGLVLGRVLQWS